MGKVRRVDLVIRGGAVIDGSGAPRTAADVAVAGDRVAAVGRLEGVAAADEIDAAGLAVAPGFIDAHTHDDCALLSIPDMAPKASQGVTTVIAGNCGVSLAPLAIDGPPPGALALTTPEPGWYRFPRFADFVSALGAAPPAVNAGLLCGHITLRRRVMDRLDRAATPGELKAMRALLEESMAAGAVGFSTGLDYAEAVAAPAAEVEALASAVKPFGGMFCVHHRNYFDGLEAALEEAFAIGRSAGVPTVISHHQLLGAGNFGKARKTLDMIDAAGKLAPVGLDAYPYAASSKTLDPERAKPGVRIMITWSTPFPEFAGRDLDAVAAEWGVPAREAAQRLLPAGATYFQFDENDVAAVLAHPETMIGSDSLPHDAHPHPRLWGAFPRMLGHYARERGLVALEEAVRRMTSLPARWFGLKDRGLLRAGAFADLVVFDPETVIDRSTFTKPVAAARGIAAVVVNGRTVWRDGRPTGARPGRVLHRDPSAAVGGRERA